MSIAVEEELDYDLWVTYLLACEEQDVHPSIRDYVIWRQEYVS